jgi:endonuclease/exonuclease/phosphatase (EEP) superfamily protein YafD
LAKFIGWTLVAASLVLHFVTVVAYHRQPDPLAAFTVMPFWAWGGLGFGLAALAFYFLRAPLSLVLSAIWAFTTLIGSDEARVIGNLAHPPPEPGIPAPVDNRRPIRVATLNAAKFRFGDPTADLAVWEPDIVLLQELPTHRVKALADALYQGRGDYRAYALNGVVTRWKISREVRNPDPRFRFFNHNVTVVTPDHGPIEVVNLHLSSAATNLELWKREAWKTHRNHRRERETEIAVALRVLEDTTDFPGPQPVILGGDFNAPPADASLRPLKADFDDAFAVAGRGWGNTYHRRIPLFRIDQIHVSRHFTPVRCRAVTTRRSDHRFVIADLLLN